MNYHFLAQLAFEPQLSAVILLTILAGVFLRRVPRLLCGLIVVFVLASVFPDNLLAFGLGRLAALILPVALAVGGTVLGLRLILGVERRSRRCERCGCHECHCCRHH